MPITPAVAVAGQWQQPQTQVTAVAVKRQSGGYPVAIQWLSGGCPANAVAHTYKHTHTYTHTHAHTHTLSHAHTCTAAGQWQLHQRAAAVDGLINKTAKINAEIT